MRTISRRKRHIPAVFLIGVLLCSGCGNGAENTIPELIEPSAVNTAYRPVELGSIGETKVLYGTVKPTEYCFFFDSYVGVKDITVEVGDYVEAGDIVAYADVDMAKEQLEGLYAQMENENQNYEYNSKIAEIRIRQIKEELETAEEEIKTEKTATGEATTENTTSSETIENAETENKAEEATTVESPQPPANPEEGKTTEKANIKNNLATQQENIRYDKILHEYRVNKLQEAINSQQKIIDNGTLKATHSGYVTYTKNLGEGIYAAGCENIVIVANPQETYIELTDKTIGQYEYEDYEVKYMQISGKTFNVTEISYSMDAEILAKAEGKYPNVRLSCLDVGELTIGETYPIFYREKRIEDVPVVGLDSVNGEKDAYYVYVEGENEEKEKRSIEIGEKDNYYAQVISGLEVGEAVYYESETGMPAHYDEYPVERSDFSVENISRSYRMADEQVFWYSSESAGTIAELAVKKGDEVKEGDLLYVLLAESGKAALAEASNNISRENTTYRKNIKNIEKSIKAEKDKNNKKILEYQKKLETVNHTYRLQQLEKTYNKMARNNDGNGTIHIYAGQSGTVSEVTVEEGTAVNSGTLILSVGNEAGDKLLVQMEPLKDEKNYADIADFGEKVTITAEEDTYSGTCIGMTTHNANNLEKYYVSSGEDGPVISYCTASGYSYPAFYVEMEEESFYQNMPKGKLTFSYVAMEDVIVIPTALVQEEKNPKNPVKTDYFVWRIVGDELVKQYVLVDKTYSDINKTVILSGIQEQDILAREK